MRWTISILGAWAAIWMLTELPRALPVAWWFAAGEIHVEDARRGECPRMTFARDINGDFHANWTVTLLRQGSSGAFYTYRTFRGSNDYRPGNALPDDLDLCWWVWSDTIDLIPGIYRVNTLWRLHVGVTVRDVRRTSNQFEVRP